MTTRPDFAALIGSRICHDLISPIGAIGNGVELLMMESASAGPEMELISESVASASARIRFFRVAFGAADPAQRVGRSEVMSILSDMTRGGRLQIDWRAGADLPRTEVKLAFLLLQCLETAMPFGGRITVSSDDGWRIRGEAARFRADPALWQVLQGGAAEVAPAHVQFALAPHEAAALNRSLQVSLGEDAITLSF